ncbi:ribonuclease Z [Candidatus Pacearchaeota archaeon]|nr:ribonuclease Z [Candidatus Pacearchaeota archaeon]
MQQIKIIFLGTSQAIPTETRNHTSILLQYKGENILIDCGEGTQRQFRKAKLNMCKVNKLLITHWHGDHVLGIPGFLQSLALNNYSKTLEVYGPLGTKKFMYELMNIFIPVNKIKLVIKEAKGTFFEDEDFSLEAIQLTHTIPVNGYSFNEKNKLKIKKEKLNAILKKLNPSKEDFQKLDLLKQGKDILVKGKKIKYKELTELEKGRKVSFIFDTGYCSNAKKLAQNADIAIIESTYAEEEKDLAKQYLHLTSVMAAEIAKAGKAKQLILTHISQRHEFKEKNLLNEAKKIFPNTKIAHDLMEVNL